MHKINTQKAGERGEQAACDFLENEGYQVLERNWRFGRSEIDIIAQIDGLIIFVEVKYRASEQFGAPEQFLTDDQIIRITKAADQYLYIENLDVATRFDIITIKSIQGKLEVKHLKDAFYC